MAKLDRNRPFGICGSNTVGKKTCQDGKYFNAKDQEIDENGKLVTRKSIPANPAIVGKKKVKKAAKKAKKEQ